jgi:hypothetical protein
MMRNAVIMTIGKLLLLRTDAPPPPAGLYAAEDPNNDEDDNIVDDDAGNAHQHEALLEADENEEDNKETEKRNEARTHKGCIDGATEVLNRDRLFTILHKRFADVSSYTRSKLIQTYIHLIQYVIHRCLVEQCLSLSNSTSNQEIRLCRCVCKQLFSRVQWND